MATIHTTAIRQLVFTTNCDDFAIRIFRVNFSFNVGGGIFYARNIAGQTGANTGHFRRQRPRCCGGRRQRFARMTYTHLHPHAIVERAFNGGQ